MNTHQKRVIQAVCYLELLASVIELHGCEAAIAGIDESEVEEVIYKIRSLSKKLLKDVNVTALSGPLSDRPQNILDN